MKQKLKHIKITNIKISAKISTRVRLAFVSDLHDCPNEPILNCLSKIAPHAVLVGGDFIHNNEIYKNGVSFLKSATKLCPVFCAVGNHEKRYKGDLGSLVNSTGAVFLDNSYIEFKDIKIGGLTSGHDGEVVKGLLYSSIPNLEWLKSFDQEKGFKILICHHPEYFDEYIKPTKIPITLSGHAHGGQWRFFGHGILAPGQGLFPKYTSGIYHQRLIVSRGLGNPRIVPRINNSPEIICLDINPK